MNVSTTEYDQDYLIVPSEQNHIDESSGRTRNHKFTTKYFHVSLLHNNENEIIISTVDNNYKKKREEWIRLVGKERFNSLDDKLQDFLIYSAGMIDLGFPIDIKQAYSYSIFNDET